MDTGADRRDQAVDDRRGYDSGEGISSQLTIRLINEFGKETEIDLLDGELLEFEPVLTHVYISLKNGVLILDCSL